jgi:hypothetical protein
VTASVTRFRQSKFVDQRIALLEHLNLGNRDQRSVLALASAAVRLPGPN